MSYATYAEKLADMKKSINEMHSLTAKLQQEDIAELIQTVQFIETLLELDFLVTKLRSDVGP